MKGYYHQHVAICIVVKGDYYHQHVAGRLGGVASRRSYVKGIGIFFKIPILRYVCFICSNTPLARVALESTEVRIGWFIHCF